MSDFKKIMIKKLFLFIFAALAILPMTAQEYETDSVKIFFRQSKVDLVPSLHGNQTVLDSITKRLSVNYGDSMRYRLRRVDISGGASPEGSIEFNKWLSEHRAATLFNYLSEYGTFPDSLKNHVFIGRDWHGLTRMVENDPNVPYRDDVLRFLKDSDLTNAGDSVRALKRLHDYKPYYYMYNKLFPELRASKVVLYYELIPNVYYFDNAWLVPATPQLSLKPFAVNPQATPGYVVPSPKAPFYMDIRTNMLYDLMTIPNIGVDFYLGKNISIGANWRYSWWNSNKANWYWRTYGGDINLRYWLGKAAHEKPLQGHHVGVYGQVFTYDFEVGGKGIMGGKPRGDIFDKCNFIVAAEYGYSLPITRRLNIDFSAAFGYMGGEYREYEPIDNCYVWQTTKERHYFGPTKVEVALVWLIGRGNVNKNKGGRCK